MDSKKLFDLRFVIGAFFLILGTILVGASWFGPSDLVQGIRLNLCAGLGMLTFGALMAGSVFWA
jgi:hypothetical protein